MRYSDDLKGKTCMVTGATSGIGLVTAKALAKKGATVIVVGRNHEKSASTVARIQRETGNPSIEFMLADLSIRMRCAVWLRNSKVGTRDWMSWSIMPATFS